MPDLWPVTAKDSNELVLRNYPDDDALKNPDKYPKALSFSPDIIPLYGTKANPSTLVHPASLRGFMGMPIIGGDVNNVYIRGYGSGGPHVAYLRVVPSELILWPQVWSRVKPVSSGPVAIPGGNTKGPHASDGPLQFRPPHATGHTYSLIAHVFEHDPDKEDEPIPAFDHFGVDEFITFLSQDKNFTFYNVVVADPTLGRVSVSTRLRTYERSFAPIELSFTVNWHEGTPIPDGLEVALVDDRGKISVPRTALISFRERKFIFEPNYDGTLMLNIFSPHEPALFQPYSGLSLRVFRSGNYPHPPQLLGALNIIFESHGTRNLRFASPSATKLREHEHGSRHNGHANGGPHRGPEGPERRPPIMWPGGQGNDPKNDGPDCKPHSFPLYKNPDGSMGFYPHGPEIPVDQSAPQYLPIEPTKDGRPVHHHDGPIGFYPPPGHGGPGGKPHLPIEPTKDGRPVHHQDGPIGFYPPPGHGGPGGRPYLPIEPTKDGRPVHHSDGPIGFNPPPGHGGPGGRPYLPIEPTKDGRPVHHHDGPIGFNPPPGHGGPGGKPHLPIEPTKDGRPVYRSDPGHGGPGGNNYDPHHLGGDASPIPTTSPAATGWWFRALITDVNTFPHNGPGGYSPDIQPVGIEMPTSIIWNDLQNPAIDFSTAANIELVGGNNNYVFVRGHSTLSGIDVQCRIFAFDGSAILHPPQYTKLGIVGHVLGTKSTVANLSISVADPNQFYVFNTPFIVQAPGNAAHHYCFITEVRQKRQSALVYPTWPSDQEEETMTNDDLVRWFADCPLICRRNINWVPGVPVGNCWTWCCSTQLIIPDCSYYCTFWTIIIECDNGTIPAGSTWTLQCDDNTIFPNGVCFEGLAMATKSPALAGCHFTGATPGYSAKLTLCINWNDGGQKIPPPGIHCRIAMTEGLTHTSPIGHIAVPPPQGSDKWPFVVTSKYPYIGGDPNPSPLPSFKSAGSNEWPYPGVPTFIFGQVSLTAQTNAS